MRITVLALGLLVALPAPAQDAAAPPPVQLPALPPEVQARADTLLIQGTQHLVAGRRADAAPLVREALALAAPAEDVAQLQGMTQFDVYSRWLEGRSAAMKVRDFATFARWAWRTSAFNLLRAAERNGETGPVTPDDVDDLFYMSYGLVLAGEEDRATAFLAPFLAAPDPAFEIAFAKDMAQRAVSVQNWGGQDKPRAARLVAFAIAAFDRPAARAPDAVRDLYRVQGQILRTAGDFAGARAAFAKARKPGTPPADAELALMFALGEVDAGIRAVQQAVGDTPGSALSRRAADRLIEVAGQSGSGNAATIAIYERVWPLYRRTLKIDDLPLQNVGSVLANLYVETGDPAKAEPILIDLLALAEKRWGPESNGALMFVLELAASVEAQNRLAEAELLYRRIWALALRYDIYEPDDAREAFEGITRSLLGRGLVGDALAFTADGIARVRAAKDINAWRRMFYLLARADALEASGALADAEAHAREALALGDSDEKMNIAAMFDDPNVFARARLAHLLERQGRAAQAEPIRRLLLARIEGNDMIPWEGEYRTAALLALAANLTLQGKPEGSRRFAERLDASTRIYGLDSPQMLAVAEPFARALLQSGRAAAALAPARLALAARTSTRFTGDAIRANLSDLALARKRTEAARLMVEAAWKASRR
ncbi:tetratricopeptide repeat protein [Sphingomonas sp.]|uniref:tetratricopeptide repeat protein n=1 Tax=Sphingomonas sp. TaxID=28214 RepID=UPI00307D8EAF